MKLLKNIPSNIKHGHNLMGMPVTGERVTLGDVADFTVGKRIAKTNGTVPIISSGAKPVGYTDTPSHPSGTITISFKGSVGNVYRWNEPIWADQCVVVTPKACIDADYLYYCLKVLETQLKQMHNGGLIPDLDITKIKKTPFFLPVMTDQLMLAHIVSELERHTNEHLDTTQSRLERLTAMFKQMSGDIFEYLRAR